MQRDTVILGLLSQQPVLSIAEICTHCNCSAVTARRDLIRLEEQGLLRRTHGGAARLARLSAGPHGVVNLAALEARLALVDRSDALIVTPNDAEPTRILVERARRAGRPIIAEANKYPGAHTLVAIDDYQAGVELGRWVGYYIRDHLRAQPKVLEVGHPIPNCEARTRGFSDGLREITAELRVIMRLDERELRSPARLVVADALAVHPDINVIFAINDDSALGAVDACRAAGVNLDRLLVAWFGLEGRETRDLLAQGNPFKVCVAMFPEIVGRACVDAATCILQSCPVPDRIITPHAIVTAETLDRYYCRDEGPDGWALNFSAIQQLPTANAGYRLLAHPGPRWQPARLGWIKIYSSHDWYRNVERAMHERSRELGIQLEVLDASQDIARDVDALKRAIGYTAARSVQSADTIIIDAGATTRYLAQALRGRCGITVITNSLLALSELGSEPGITLVSSGGVVRPESHSLTGPAAEATFHDLHVDKTFLTGTGVSAGFGLSNTNVTETGVKHAMLRAGEEAILLADHTKIGVDSLVRIAPLDAIDRLITDAGISAHDRQAFTQRGVEVVIAEEEDL